MSSQLKPEIKLQYIQRLRHQPSFLYSKITFYFLIFIVVILLIQLLTPPSYSPENHHSSEFSNQPQISSRSNWGGSDWEKSVRSSARVKRGGGFTVLVTGAAGFIGSQVALALKKRGDGVLGLDNFNSYYDPLLKRSRQRLMEKSGGFIVEGDINDYELLAKLFDVVAFTHVMHLAAQAGVRYAMVNPGSYVNSNVAGFISVLEACKAAEPQPAVVWASSSSVYGLNSIVPFSELDRTDRPASLYAATKKAGEAIAHSYNHIYGLSITGLRFFTVYGPWGRPDMAYFFFTKNITERKEITIFEAPDRSTVARDFTYIDDVVKGCVAALDTAKRSTGIDGKKRGPAQFRIFNLGNTNPVPVEKLVSILEKLLGKSAKRKIVQMPMNGDVQYTHANISLAARELGYRPSTDLETGLKKFTKCFQLPPPLGLWSVPSTRRPPHGVFPCLFFSASSSAASDLRLRGGRGLRRGGYGRGWRVEGAGGGLSGGLFLSFVYLPFSFWYAVCYSNRVYDAVLGRRRVRLWLALLAKLDVFDSCAGDAGASDGWAFVLVGVAYGYLPILGLLGFGAGCGVSRRARWVSVEADDTRCGFGLVRDTASISDGRMNFGFVAGRRAICGVVRLGGSGVVGGGILTSVSDVTARHGWWWDCDVLYIFVASSISLLLVEGDFPPSAEVLFLH
ncbi:hypothetical protein QQ045_000611 [Rhodiola kirilowii]